MSLYINAELLIKQCIREYDLNKIECDFSKILEDLKDQMEYLKANKELRFIGDEDVKQSPQLKTKQLKAPVIALFCNLASESKLIPKDENESVQTYCERVCKEFKLPYSDRVRQNFNGSNTKENRKKVTNERSRNYAGHQINV